MKALRGLLGAGLLATTILAATPATASEAIPTPPGHRLHDFDGERSDVAFELRVLLRHLRGRFLSLRGSLLVDEARQHADIDVSLDSNSVWMAKESNAEYARSGEFFDAERFPHIRFHASDVPMTLFRRGGAMSGEVELRGIRRSMTLDVEPANCERPGIDCDVSASGAVDRSEFGMTSKTFFVGKQVELFFRIRLRDVPEEPGSNDSGTGT